MTTGKTIALTRQTFVSLYNLKEPQERRTMSLGVWFFFLTESLQTADFCSSNLKSLPPLFLHGRFHSFLLFMGHPPYAIREVNINKFCRIISEFALEYRTTRERVLQQKQKRANHRERNKTRGKMITDVSFMKSVSLRHLF